VLLLLFICARCCPMRSTSPQVCSCVATKARQAVAGACTVVDAYAGVVLIRAL
jgi:hypothetical protein